MDFRELRFARAMQFSIHEINNRTDLLPGITLGYQIHDSCSSVPMSIKVAFQFANGVESMFNDTDVCAKSAAVPAIIGESASTPSISMARTLGLFGIPQVQVACYSIFCNMYLKISLKIDYWCNYSFLHCLNSR